MSWTENIFEVMDPFDVCNCASPCNDYVTASQAFDLFLVGGYCHVTHPVCMWAPHAAHVGFFLEEVWEVDVGGCVEIAGDGVASVRHVKLVEEM